MKSSTRIQQHDRQRGVTTIYFADGTPLVVEALEWGGGSTPVLVRTVDNQVMRLGIEANWSCYPSQDVAVAFLTMRQNVLKQQQWDYGADPADYRNVA